jgi:hypothetical protein
MVLWKSDMRQDLADNEAGNRRRKKANPEAKVEQMRPVRRLIV